DGGPSACRVRVGNAHALFQANGVQRVATCTAYAHPEKSDHRGFEFHSVLHIRGLREWRGQTMVGRNQVIQLSPETLCFHLETQPIYPCVDLVAARIERAGKGSAVAAVGGRSRQRALGRESNQRIV